ncbi:MAG: phosphoadenosine phosphosulfate reductase family protein, partial [Candidatus Njordarchaeales archaeon]
MHRAPFLGKIRLFWCHNCNVPLISDKCDLCGGKGETVKIAPPGDPRPAFLGDYELLKRTLSNLFSPRIVNVFLKEHILLNPASYIDKMDEIIVQGKVIGDLRYNPEKSEYE